MIENNQTMSTVDEESVCVIDDRICIIKKSDWDALNDKFQRLSDDLNQLRAEHEELKMKVVGI